MASRRRQQQRQSESEFLSIVPDEVLIEILVRISDYRNVIRATLVCKRWFKLISHSKYFSQSFFNRLLGPNSDNSHSSLPYTLLFRPDYGTSSPYTTTSIPYAYYDFFSEKSKILLDDNNSNGDGTYLDFLGFPNPCIRSSFDDLLLIQRNENLFYICNPLTKQWVALPEAPLYQRQKFTCGLVCEKSDNNYSRIIKYRVVLFTFDYRTAVFSSETGEWKESSFWVPVGIKRNWHSRAIACNGILYWKLLSTDDLNAIVAFDPFKGQYRFICPPVAIRDGACAHLGVVRGRLRLSHKELFDLKVWELNSSNDSNDDWILVHDIVGKLTDSLMGLIGMHPDGDGFFFFRRTSDDEFIPSIHKYMIGSDSFEKVCDYWKLWNEWWRDIGVVTLVHPWLPTKIPPCIHIV